LAVRAGSLIQSPRRIMTLAAAGILLGFAAGLKAYYLAFVPVILLVVSVVPAVGSWWRRQLDVAALVSGVVIGLLPVAWLWARSPEAFWFDNLEFHRITSRLYATGSIQNGNPAIRPQERLLFVVDSLGASGMVPVLVTIVVALVLWRRHERHRLSLSSIQARIALAAGGGAIVAAAVAFAMVPCWPQYTATWVPLWLLALGGVIGLVPERALGTLRLLLLGVVAVVVPLGLARSARGLALLASPGHWVGVKKHELALRLERTIPFRLRGEPVASFHQIYAVEAGLPIYPELATAEFLYWAGDTLTPLQREKYVATSRATIASLLTARPPCAVVVGVGAATDERPLETFALTHGYLLEPGFDQLRVYVHP